MVDLLKAFRRVRGIISRTPLSTGLAALLCAVLSVDGIAEMKKLARRPNLVVVVADDMGFSDAGCYGGEIETPNLDRLAAGGLRFSQCYNNSLCGPSRHCILTGYYYSQTGNLRVENGALRPGWAKLLPHYLKPLGYRCYHSGKWHLTIRPVADAAFARSYLVDDQERYFSPTSHDLDDVPLPAIQRSEGYYATTAIADHAVEFLREHAAAHGQSPFMLYLAFTAPHFPLQAIRDDIAKYKGRYGEGWDTVRQRRWKRLKELGLVNCDLSEKETCVPPPVVLSNVAGGVGDPLSLLGTGETAQAPPWNELSDGQKGFQAMKMAIHAAMITRMDVEIGRVLGQLRAMGAFDNTVVFFVSDNGACATIMIRGDGHDPKAEAGGAASYLCLGPGWANTCNSPFRRYKVWTHEGGISSPLIVHWPQGIPCPAGIRHTPVHFIDFVPTLVELAGGGPDGMHRSASAPALPGRSFARCFSGDTDLGRDCLFFEVPWRGGFHGIRQGDFKLIDYPDATKRSGRSGWELYNIEADRCEMKNLACRMPGKVKELSALWERRHAQFSRQMTSP